MLRRRCACGSCIDDFIRTWSNRVNVGRKEVIGRPILYGTTEEFLKCFGLDCIEDLPALPEKGIQAEIKDYV